MITLNNQNDYKIRKLLITYSKKSNISGKKV